MLCAWCIDIIDAAIWILIRCNAKFCLKSTSWQSIDAEIHLTIFIGLPKRLIHCDQSFNHTMCSTVIMFKGWISSRGGEGARGPFAAWMLSHQKIREAGEGCREGSKYHNLSVILSNVCYALKYLILKQSQRHFERHESYPIHSSCLHCVII